MKTIARKFKSASFLLMGVILLTSCMKDGLIEPDLKDGQAQISFNFTTPEPMKVQTRASVAEENHVEMLHLLIFNSGKLVKAVTKTSAELSSSTTTTSKDTWGLKTTLTVGKQYDFVTVANVPLPATTAVGMSKADFVMAINAQAYIDTNLTNTSKWMVSNTKPIPMWEEVSTAGNVVSTDEFTIPLKRLMARVNVSVAAAAQSSFELTQVRFYNYNTKGQIIPNHDGTEYKYPSIPAVSGKQTTASPAFFGYNNTDGLTATACQNLIYVFENANIGKYSDGGAKKWQDNPTVVIGGKFGGGAETFYRLDFIKVESGNETWLDIKRNHSYNFNITKVNGNGYLNPEDALMSAPINMVATVIQWDDGAVAEVTEDGQYKMGVSEKIYSFSKESSLNNALSIYTTYTQTDLVVKYSDSETNADAGSAWLTQASITNDGGSDMRIYDLKFDVLQNDNAPRTGYIHLKSGRMHMVVKVIQSDMVSISLQILRETSAGVFDQEVSMIQFVQENAVSAATAQNYKIKWSPYTATVAINMSSLGGDLITWSGSAPDADGTITDPFGEKTFTVQPTTFTTYVEDSFAERQSLMTARMVVSGEMTLKTVVFQQMVKDMHIDYAGAYLMDGVEKKHFVTVRSNVNWDLNVTKNISSGLGTSNVAVVEDLSVGDKLVADGSYNLPQGNKVYFTPVEDLTAPEIYTGHLGLDLIDKTSTLTTIPSELFCASGIIQPLSNSYLVAPKSIPILIPVKRANGVMNDGTTIQPGWTLGNQITGKYSAELVWTDKAHTTSPVESLGDDGAVKMIVAAGSDEDGYIFVMPGKGDGNAVVSAKVGNDIVWSWHIWVVDNYNPNPATDVWMDRNLGATTNSYIANSPSTLGLYYQRGRKDPMPGAASPSQVNGTPGCMYYLGNNTPTNASTWVAGTGTLSSSILEPLKNYTTWAGSNGDDSWITNHNQVAGTGDKTIYDPCPDGWQVPVFKTQAWNNPANTRYWGQEIINIYSIWSTSGNKWANKGIDWPTKGGYYPGAGYRYSGGLGDVSSSYGYYWSASTISTYGYHLGFYSGTVHPSYNIKNYLGFSVRCVAVEP